MSGIQGFLGPLSLSSQRRVQFPLYFSLLASFIKQDAVLIRTHKPTNIDSEVGGKIEAPSLTTIISNNSELASILIPQQKPKLVIKLLHIRI
jgi:hypothetical protein